MLLASCAGGGGGHHGGGGGGGGGGGNGIATGTFFDVAVRGLNYAASPSGLGGTTDQNGTFQFKDGDTVTFTLVVGPNVLQLGSITLSAPNSGTVQMFVLSMPNGLTIAQVLQSLNHGSSAAIDVSGLVLNAADATALNDYISSGGTALPPTATTDLQMLAQVQTDSNLLASSFVIKGGASVAMTLAALDQALSGLPAANLDLSTKVPGKLVFDQFFILNSGIVDTQTSIAYLGTSGQVVSVSPNSTTNPKTQNYSINGNVLTIVENNGTTISYTVAYGDSVEALWTASNGTASAPGYSLFLQQSLAPSAIAGKTLLLAGAINRDCGGANVQIQVDAAGANYSVGCSNANGLPAGAQLSGGTIAAVVSMPGVISLTDSSGAVFYLALLKNGSLQDGTLAMIETNAPAGKTPFVGLYQINLP